MNRSSLAWVIIYSAAVVGLYSSTAAAQGRQLRMSPSGPAMTMAAPAARLPAPPSPAPHLRVAHLRAPHDLNGYRVVNKSTGAVFNVYFDEASRPLAERQLVPLDAMLTEVAALSLVDPSEVVWGAVIFAAEHDPAHRGSDTRWSVRTNVAGALTPEGERMLFNTLPHEQAHAAQKARHVRLPRWFSEGHASWVGLKVTRRLNAAIAEEWRTRAIAASQAPDYALDLSSWGGVRVTGDMIRAQLPPAEQAKMDRDPNYRPTGAFEFKVGETLSDESQTLARYGAALAVFEGLETKGGRKAVEAWVRAVWDNPTAPGTPQIVALAQRHTGEDIGPRLGPRR